MTTLDILIVAQHCALKAIMLAQHSSNQMRAVRNQFAYAAAYAAYAAAIEAKMGGEDEMVLTHARSAVDYALSAGVAYEDLIVEASRIGWFGEVASPTAC